MHSAKGREWQVVAVAGLQEGSWPNLKQRGSLLGSERLVERIRYGAMPVDVLNKVAASGLLHDERRLMYVAVTRASSKLIVTSVKREEDVPSLFFEEIAESLYGEEWEPLTLGATRRPITPLRWWQRYEALYREQKT